MTVERSESGLAGQVMTDLTPAELAPAFRRAGLDARFVESTYKGASARLLGVGEADCSLQRGDPGEYLVLDAGGERGALADLARALSATLTGMGIRHRLELYDADHQMVLYLHFEFPLS
jgi:hypothetical protein